MVNSVELLREIDKYVKKRTYIHELDFKKGINKIVAKVVNIEGILILYKHKKEGITQREIKVLEKILQAIKNNIIGLAFSNNELSSIMAIATRWEELKGIELVVAKLRGREGLTESDIENWGEKIESELEKLSSLIDFSLKYMKIKLDDGLSELNAVITVKELENLCIKEGDIVNVKLAENVFTKDNGYLVAKDDYENLFKVEKVKKIDK